MNENTVVMIASKFRVLNTVRNSSGAWIMVLVVGGDGSYKISSIMI
jgi:hypothetical protein